MRSGARDVDVPLISGRASIAAAIGGFEVVVKSPGISLYDPLVVRARADGVRFTSLLNLWFADAPTCRTICVTGTKGKSTTTALIAHILRGVGWNAVAAGNIGVPVTELPRDGLDAAVIEVSSYQAADFDGQCDIAVLTSLYQEHLDWHGSVAAYRRDKLNLLRHARHALIKRDALAAVAEVLDLDRLDHATFAACRRVAREQPLSRAPAQPVQPGRLRWRWRDRLASIRLRRCARRRIFPRCRIASRRSARWMACCMSMTASRPRRRRRSPRSMCIGIER